MFLQGVKESEVWRVHRSVQGFACMIVSLLGLNIRIERAKVGIFME